MTKLDTRKLALAVKRIRNLDEVSDRIFDPQDGRIYLFPEDRSPLVTGLHEAIKGAAEELYAVFHPAQEPDLNGSAESEIDIVNEVGEQLREKLSQIRNAPGAIISFEVWDGDFNVNVSIERDETNHILTGGRRVSA